MFEELKPCPFCGDEAVLHVDNGVSVICTHCGCRTIALVDGSSYGKPTGSAVRSVIEKWNRRAAVNER